MAPQSAVDGRVDEGPPVILLVDASTTVERGLVETWVRESGLNQAVMLPLQPEAMAGPLAHAADDTVVTPVRVVWRPREREGRRRARFSDLLLTAARPTTWAQALVARHEPDRAAVVAADSATLGDLRRRLAARSGGRAGGGRGGNRLAGFVAQQARLALHRAERALLGDRYKVPTHIVEAITISAEFDTAVGELAERLELPVAEVRERVEHDLHGLVASMNPAAIDLLTGVLRPLHARAWQVQTDSAGLEKLRELNRTHPLVFLPSHRSYADPMLLADVLADHDFPRNHVLGGENLSFWPVGPLAKRAGIVFIRRVFGDDEVYKLAVREYFGYLLAKRFNLEWYMEGGRSRTGKLRTPRHGLLTGVAEAVERGRVGDVYLVPVSITYDQLREVSAMAAEQVGAPKKGEGLGWLARYAKAQLEPIGNAYVRFAEPISLRRGLEAVSRDDPDGRRKALQKVAFEVAVGINSVTPVVATALVTLTLLGVRDRALTLGQVQRVLEPVREYVLARGQGDADVPSAETLRTAGGLRRVLRALAASKVVTIYSGGEEPVYAIDRGQHLVAAFYRNSAIHHFVDRAIAEVVLLDEPERRREALAGLRDLLKFEFFFPDRQAHEAQIGAELDRLGASWEAPDGPAVLAGADFLIAHRVLRSFLDAQLVVAERLAARDPRTPVVEKDFLDECAGMGQQMLLQGRLHGSESLSRELFTSALKLAANLDLVDPGREELARGRQAFAARLRETVAKLVRIDEMEAAAHREVTGVAP
jgi:glycerol-3-phosphate O-acyltransferase